MRISTGIIVIIILNMVQTMVDLTRASFGSLALLGLGT